MGHMNSGLDSVSGLDVTSSLELALDQATDRYWASLQAQRSPQRAQRHAVMTTALVVTAAQSALATLPARLRWKDVEVSEEFQRYALRIARGEQLAPYRGQVLARHCPEFPWAVAHTRRKAKPNPIGKRGAKLATLILGVGATLLAAVGVGAGAASPTEDEIEPLAPVQGYAALRPAPYVLDAEPAPSPKLPLELAARDAARRHSANTPASTTRGSGKGPGHRRLPSPAAPSVAASSAPLASNTSDAASPRKVSAVAPPSTPNSAPRASALFAETPSF